MVADPDIEARHWNAGLPEAGIYDAEMPAVLDRLRAERAGQRGCPRFGEFADREVACLRRRGERRRAGRERAGWTPDPRPEVADDGTALRGEPDGWPFNSPVAPEIADQKISATEFEEHWARARAAGFSE